MRSSVRAGGLGGWGYDVADGSSASSGPKRSSPPKGPSAATSASAGGGESSDAPKEGVAMADALGSELRPEIS